MSQKYTLNVNGPERPQVVANLHAFVDRLPENRAYVVEIKRWVKVRSDPQNHALFGVAYPALEEATGFTKDELHEAFCKRFFGTVEREVLGEITKRPFRTTTTDEHGERDVISSTEFGKFYDMVQRTGAEAGIDVPSPVPNQIRERTD